ncbi:hypothetical protein M3M35_06840 [Fructilactobacillus myrtifloralis]|uniref:Uncharacterized protein n=1 Tax=Fructilactobacillus myrtifloralis TaxID=2940301 RepID=A0ABY5BPJ1_9LACO|nr:hypothetical protein [Fructilactobacillus myrtifloralis]USS84998.1 hypothetical protein M3M35_06840 [Fructilactobacillus myrtifloralis]
MLEVDVELLEVESVDSLTELVDSDVVDSLTELVLSLLVSLLEVEVDGMVAF